VRVSSKKVLRVLAIVVAGLLLGALAVFGNEGSASARAFAVAPHHVAGARAELHR
jgi:hypothetical protein